MKWLSRLFRRKPKLHVVVPTEPERDVVNEALRASLGDVYRELGLERVITTEKLTLEVILGLLGGIKQGIVHFKATSPTLQVIEMVKSGKKVPVWLQKLIKEAIERESLRGEPEDIRP